MLSQLTSQSGAGGRPYWVLDGEGAFMTVRHVTSNPFAADTDGDGLSDLEEFDIRSDPSCDDTDGDGLTDEDEGNQWYTSPNSIDADGDARGPDAHLPPVTAGCSSSSCW